ncbi:PQQ-binding-like beta-propeller repeat protein [Thermodesulfobacteriota bacterium]
MRELLCLSMIFVVIIAIGCASSIEESSRQLEDRTHEWFSEGAPLRLDDQIRMRRPRYTLALPDRLDLAKGEIYFIGHRICVPILEEGSTTYFMFDLENAKILWRKAFPETATIQKAGVLDNGDIYVQTFMVYSTKIMKNILVVMDGQTGEERWQYPNSSQGGGNTFLFAPHSSVHYIIERKKIIALDAKTYSVLSSTDRFKKEFINNKVLIVPERTLIFDHGLHIFSGETGAEEWSSRFPTYAVYHHTKGNVGRFMGGILLAGLTGLATGGRASFTVFSHKGPSYIFPPPLAVPYGDEYIVSALNNVICLDRSSGEVSWASALDISFVEGMDIDDRAVTIYCSAKCGNGIYSLSREDGSSRHSFRSPFTHEMHVEGIDPESLGDISEKEAWRRNEICFDAILEGEGDMSIGELIDAAFTEDAVLALTKEEIVVIDKDDGSIVEKIALEELGCSGLDALRVLPNGEALGLSKYEVISLDLEGERSKWALEFGWSASNMSSFRWHALGEGMLIFHGVIGKDILGGIGRGLVVNLESGELLSEIVGDEIDSGDDWLILRDSNRIEIYTENE